MSKEHQKYLKELRKKKILIFLGQITIFIIFIILWQLLTDMKIIDAFIVSSPKKIIMTISNLYSNNNLFIHIETTIYETIISFVVSMIIGIVSRVFYGHHKF